MKKCICALASAAVLGAAGTAGAAFINVGGGMIYDDVQNITWLEDSNYTLHHGQGDIHGQMTWSAANSYAESFEYAGYTDWRLPHGPTEHTSEPVTTLATGGELYNLYYELGNTATSTWMQKGDFDMIWTGSFWTDLDAGWTSGSHHWLFDGSLGSNYFIGPDSNHELVWLVRDGSSAYDGGNGNGDNGTAPVPEPSTVMFLGSGLAYLAFHIARKRREE